MTVVPLEADPPPAADGRAIVVVGIAHARMAAAVLELLHGEDRWNVVTYARTRIPRDAALAVVDVPYLVRSSRPLRVPTVVLLRSDVERETAEARVPAVREWLRTSSTGEELVAAIERALAVTSSPEGPSSPQDLRVVPEGAQVAEDDPARPTASEVGLLAFGTAAGAIALAFLWQVVRP